MAPGMALGKWIPHGRLNLREQQDRGLLGDALKSFHRKASDWNR